MRYAPWTALWVQFNPQAGTEQAGRRPAIVVGSNLAGQIGARNGLVIVVPCTSTDRNLPWQPRINLNGHPGVAMCDQIKAISVNRIQGRHPGTLGPDEIDQIQQAMRSLLAI